MESHAVMCAHAIVNVERDISASSRDKGGYKNLGREVLYRDYSCDVTIEIRPFISG